jgi:hypothetical protein
VDAATLGEYLGTLYTISVGLVKQRNTPALPFHFLLLHRLAAGVSDDFFYLFLQKQKLVVGFLSLAIDQKEEEEEEGSSIRSYE